MNRIDTLKYSQFPMSSETLSFIQDMIILSARLSSALGSCYIIDGCVVNGSAATAGVVAINGEVLPFAGGAISASVVIQESKDSVQVYDDTYTGIYVNRQVIFGSGAGQLPWSSFNRLPSISEMASSISAINTTLNDHINNHSVPWSGVTDKPAAFTPAVHAHSWIDITNKPTAFPPEAHNHAGTAIYYGTFETDGTAHKIAGSIDMVNVARIATGKYQLTHRIGHTAYIVLGLAAIATTMSIRSMYDVTDNDCKVVVSDDYTPNDMGQYFVILSFA